MWLGQRSTRFGGLETADQVRARRLGQAGRSSTWRTKTELVKFGIRSKRCRKTLSVPYGKPNDF